MQPEPAFVMGLMFGALLLWFAQSMFRSRRLRKEADTKLAELREPSDQRRLREICAHNLQCGKVSEPRPVHPGTSTSECVRPLTAILR